MKDEKFEKLDKALKDADAAWRVAVDAKVKATTECDSAASHRANAQYALNKYLQALLRSSIEAGE